MGNFTAFLVLTWIFRHSKLTIQLWYVSTTVVAYYQFFFPTMIKKDHNWVEPTSNLQSLLPYNQLAWWHPKPEPVAWGTQYYVFSGPASVACQWAGLHLRLRDSNLIEWIANHHFLLIHIGIIFTSVRKNKNRLPALCLVSDSRTAY